MADIDFLKRQYYIATLGLTEAQALSMTINDLEYQFFNNPRIDRTGTGSPEGVVSAPVGTYYNDTAGTNGAWRWLKKSGTGNTGWGVVVGETGRREIISLAEAGVTGSVTVARDNATVTLVGQVQGKTNGKVINLPAGFRTGNYQYRVPILHYTSSAAYLARAYTIAADGGDFTVQGLTGTPTTASDWQFTLTYRTPDAWPTTLPGVVG